MKKGICLACLTAFLLVALTGCVRGGSEAAQPAPPPEMLRFDDLAEYFYFASSTDLTDDEFSAYVEKNSFDMNGVETKEDVIALRGAIEAAPFPVLSESDAQEAGIGPIWLHVYPETGIMTVYFIAEADKTAAAPKYCLSIDIDMAEDSAEESIKAVKKERVRLTKIEVDNMDQLYHAKVKSAAGSVYYLADVNDRYLRIKVTDELKGEALDVLSSLQFVSIKDLE